MVYIWLSLFVVLGIIEAITVSLTSIWFCIGALICIPFAAFNAPVPVQIVVFVLSSAVLLWLTRPIVKKYLMVKTHRTNADMVIGTHGRVTEEINNNTETGRVYVSGLSWLARSSDNVVIPVDSDVIIDEITGAKLMVSPVKAEVNSSEAALV